MQALIMYLEALIINLVVATMAVFGFLLLGWWDSLHH